MALIKIRCRKPHHYVSPKALLMLHNGVRFGLFPNVPDFSKGEIAAPGSHFHGVHPWANYASGYFSPLDPKGAYGITISHEYGQQSLSDEEGMR